MPDELRQRIEAYLLDHQGWVSAAELCRVFDVRERVFRSNGRRAGLLTDCAISGNAGFRHCACATDEEFTRAYGRMRRHGLGELVHARKQLATRLRIRTLRPPLVFERATGQALLLP